MVSTTSKACHRIRTQRREDIAHATGLVEEGDGESLAVSVQDTIATLSSHEIGLQDTRATKRRGEARMENAPKLADFGNKKGLGRGTPCWPSRRT